MRRRKEKKEKGEKGENPKLTKGKGKRQGSVKDMKEEEVKKKEPDPPPHEFFFDTSVLATDYYKRHRSKIMDNKRITTKEVDISFIENLAKSDQREKTYTNDTWKEIDMRL
jgi:hypothetical protein